MSKNNQIYATLENSDNEFVFNVEETAKVKFGDQVHWKVNVRDMKNDVTGVGLLVVFHGSNSELDDLAQRNWPFTESAPASTYRQAPNPKDNDRKDFAIGFGQYQGISNQTSALTLKRDTSLPERRPGGRTDTLPIVYNYSLVASIPSEQLPNDILPNSNNTVLDWPNISTHEGTGTHLIVVADPEMYVDEC